MNNFFSAAVLFCCIIPFLGSLEANLAQSEERVPVGSREMTQAERVAIQEERAHRDKAEPAGSFDAELAEGSESDQGEPIEENAITATISAKSTLEIVPLYTTHKGAHHKLVNVSATDKTIELEDGSIWRMKPDDCHKTMNWAPKHKIIITPNHNWFSIYDFRLTDENAETSVVANLSLGPIYNGTKTHWIVGIDHYSRTIVLEDGSVWNASCFDDSIVKKWTFNDTVIIGINDSWFAGKRRNILINVNTLNYAACKCINGKSINPDHG
jgi:hypothetical protein